MIALCLWGILAPRGIMRLQERVTGNPSAGVHTMTTSFATALTLSSIEAGAAKILIDPFLSWDKGWIGSRAGEDSTQGGVR